MAKTSRNPEHYTVGIPKLFFFQQKSLEDDRIVDGVALMRAHIGLVDADSGSVLNANDISTCKTPEEILTEAYIGNIVSASLGGEISSVDHTASVEGRQEIDKVVLTRRGMDYTLGFDEPNKQNIERFFSGARVNFPTSKVCIGKTTARASQTSAPNFAEGEINLLDTHLTIVGKKLELLEDFVTNQLQLNGIILDPLKVGATQAQVNYGAVIYFVVSDLQRNEKVEVQLEAYRNKVVCAFFKYDPSVGRMRAQTWPASGMDTASYKYVSTTVDERLKVFNHPNAETIVGITTNSLLRTGNTAESGIETAAWAFNADTPATHQLRLPLAALMIPGSCGVTLRGKKYLPDSQTWVDTTESLYGFTQAPDATDTRTPIRTDVMPASGGTYQPFSLVAPLAAGDDVPPCTLRVEYGTVQTESDGTISGHASVMLLGTGSGGQAEFISGVAVDADFTVGTHYTITGLPAGVTAKLTKRSAAAADLSFTGTAAPSSGVFGIALTLNEAALHNVVAADFPTLTGGLSAPLASAINASITASGSIKGDSTNMLMVGKVVFTLAGSVGETVKFAAGVATLDTGYSVVGVPAGLTPVMTKVSDTVAELTLTGTPTATTTANLSVTFLDDAFTPKPIQQFVPSAVQAVTVAFAANDAALASNNTLTASQSTPGVITGNCAYTLSGMVMGVSPNFVASVNTGTAFTPGTHYTVTGVPAGLTAVLTKTSSTVATLTLTGTATTPTGVASIDVDLLDAIYANGIKVSDIINGNPAPVTIDFSGSTASGTIAWDGTFMGQADRSVSGYLTAILSGTNAALTDSIPNGSNFVLGTHYTVTGLPSGVTAKVTKATTNRVVVMLEGQAPAASTGPETPVAAPITFGITFKDAAYKTPLTSAKVTNNSRTNVRVNFPNSARVDTGESYFINPLTSYVNYRTGELVLSLTNMFISDSGMSVGARPLQTLEVSTSFHAIMGKDALWTGTVWAQFDESYSNMRVNRGRNEITGAAIIVHQNDVGVSMLQMIPRAVLRPDGTLDYSKEDWAAGSFVLAATKSPDAYIPNLSRIVRIPFGFSITYKFRRNDM